MIWKNTMKYPVLTIGIILFIIYLQDPSTAKFWKNYKSKFIPSTCNSVMDRVGPKTPSGWEMECPGTQLLIISIEHSDVKRDYPILRRDMYRELANSYVNLARFSNPETLEYLQFVEIHMIHPELKIISKTDGLAVVELLKKKTQKDISEHIKLTVKVKEIKE